MKNLTFTIFTFVICLISCNNKDSSKQILKKNPTVETCSKNQVPYYEFKDSVNEFTATVSNQNFNRSDYLFHLINDDIYCYWKGTPWDFYGTTRTPQNGKIACGYFVTNTLSDLGFKIDRVKLAEVRSGEMINSLCTEIQTFSKYDDLETFLSKQPTNSVFIIGLDFHTGYIVKDSISYFLHSNYIQKAGVIKEPIETSSALRYNKFFMLGNITKNTKLLNAWIPNLPYR